MARFAAAMKVSESEATDVYKAALRVMSTDGTIAAGLQEKMIALQRGSLKVERDVLPEEAIAANKALAELKGAGDLIPNQTGLAFGLWHRLCQTISHKLCEKMATACSRIL